MYGWMIKQSDEEIKKNKKQITVGGVWYDNWYKIGVPPQLVIPKGVAAR